MSPRQAIRTASSLLFLFVFASVGGAAVERRATFALGGEACDDSEPEIAAQKDGTFLAVWQRCEPSSIAAQRFDAVGRRLGVEIDLGSGLFPQVTALPERGFAVAYLRELTPGFEVYGVFVRRLDPNGAPGGDPVRVDEEGAESQIYPAVPRLAAAPDGRLFVAWRNLFFTPIPVPIVQLPAFGRMLAADLAPMGPTTELGMAGLVDDLDVSFDEAGRALAATAFGGVAARRYGESGVPLGAAVEVGGGDIETFNPRLAPRPGGGWWLAWEEGGGPQASTRVFHRAVTPDGQPAGPRIDAGLLGSIETTWPAIGVDPDGRVLVTGRDRLGALQARLFDENGAAISELSPLGGPDPFPLGRAALAEGAPTGFLALWQGGLDRALPPPPGALAGWDLRGALLAASCPTPNSVCARVGGVQAEVGVRWRLFGGRFRVEAIATGVDGVERPAEALAFADRQAILSFADAGATTISLLDGRASNGKIWVYWGGLSNAAFRIAITDAMTGTTRTYANPAGKRQSRADRQAF